MNGWRRWDDLPHEVGHAEGVGSDDLLRTTRAQPAGPDQEFTDQARWSGTDNT
jgi:hypothetical protein